MSRFWQLPKSLREQMQKLLPGVVLYIPRKSYRTHRGRIVSLYRDGNLTPVDIAQKLNLSLRWVRQVLRKTGIKPPPIDREHIVRLFKQGFTIYRISRYTGLPYTRVRKVVMEDVGTLEWSPVMAMEVESAV